MPDRSHTPSSRQSRNMRPTHNRWTTVGLLAAIAAIFVLCLALAPRPTDGQEAFGGTDSAVTDVLSERGVTPWFTPIFAPNSPEVESGLFALQAALGAGAFGYLVGNLQGRTTERRRTEASPAGDRSSTLPGDTPPVSDPE